MTERKKILVIDDDATHRLCARDILEAHGYEVVLHPRPFGATEKVMTEAPDLVLLDVNMPALSGETLAMLLRAREQTRGTRILLYSSNDEDSLRTSALRLGLGPQGYVPKGDPAALRTAVDRALAAAGAASIGP
jgi:CheY-like chemotaxis protein